VTVVSELQAQRLTRNRCFPSGRICLNSLRFRQWGKAVRTARQRLLASRAAPRGATPRLTLRLPRGSGASLEDGRNRGLEARLFGVPDWVRMGRRDAQGRAPGQALQITLYAKTCSTGNSEEPGIEFQRWGSLPRPSASCPVWHRSAPFGAPDSQHSIPTTLAHPTRPGTAPDPHRSLPVDNKCYLPGGYGVPTARLGCGDGDSLEGPAGSSRHQ
jgi:hypothetical protein